MIDAKSGRALVAKWIDFEREPQCAPNPAYPDGIDVNATGGKSPTCYIKLDYPALRCGAWEVKCRLCGLTAMVTTAGRPDDPRSLTVACKMKD